MEEETLAPLAPADFAFFATPEGNVFLSSVQFLNFEAASEVVGKINTHVDTAATTNLRMAPI